MNKKKKKRKFERWDWEKLRGERDQESETNLTATTRDPSHCPDANPNGHTNATTRDPSCCRLLDLPCPASLLQPSQFTGIYFYLFLQNLIKCLWLCDLTPETENLRFIESRNCACVVRTFGLDLWCFNFHVWVFCACVVNCDELCLSVRLLPVGFFFFFCLAFWLCDSVTLCLWLVYIDKRDRERDRE